MGIQISQTSKQGSIVLSRPDQTQLSPVAKRGKTQVEVSHVTIQSSETSSAHNDRSQTMSQIAQQLSAHQLANDV